MKVKVASSREFDAFYKRFIGRINLFNVTSSLAMETLKESTELGGTHCLERPMMSLKTA